MTLKSLLCAVMLLGLVGCNKCSSNNEQPAEQSPAESAAPPANPSGEEQAPPAEGQQPPAEENGAGGGD